MMKRFCLVLIVLVGLTTAWLVAKDFWEKPFTEWKQKDVVKMLKDSPWAFESSTTSQWGGRGGAYGTGTSAGEREHFQTYTIRFLSALPVRQAYVRFMQLASGYDQVSAQEQEKMDQQFAGPLRLDVSKIIIVAVEFKSNNHEAEMQVARTLTTATAETLKQGVFLITDQSGRVEIQDFTPPNQNQPFAQIIFPRQVDGKPVVTADDKEVKFEMWMPGTGDKIFFSKKIKNMIYNGELEI